MAICPTFDPTLSSVKLPLFEPENELAPPYVIPLFQGIAEDFSTGILTDGGGGVTYYNLYRVPDSPSLLDVPKLDGLALSFILSSTPDSSINYHKVTLLSKNKDLLLLQKFDR